jgi:hypothetical protein
VTRPITEWDQLRRPYPKLGEFIFYAGKIWIVVEEKSDYQSEYVWMVDAEGKTAMWHDSECSDGNYPEAWTPAKPRKLRGVLEREAKRWRKKHGKVET